ncbi:MAG: hypothetical protein O7E52_10915 [Candidatus Poribacteria bacterium]|nr:hypothetical protein [Candidatus Poribacteria bacterium]
MSKIRFVPTGGPLGAEVRNLDLRDSLKLASPVASRRSGGVG